ncbi:MAG TPA: hypothetical protein VKX45_13150 [Bryobacteraceae bacterium]|nr:hypothetical protein [Bryobacteraceae bacterium]
MKTAVVLLLSFAAAAFAADPKMGQNPPQQPEKVKRLASVTWDLGTEKLVWIVQTGTMVNGSFVPASEQKYVISPNDAVMAVAQEQRGFDGDEAAALHHLLDVLSVYCAESVVWWDEGQGTPITPGSGAHPTQPNGDKTLERETQKPVRVGQPESAPKPRYKVPDSDYVAMQK